MLAHGFGLQKILMLMDRETMPPKMMKRTIYINCWSFSTNLFNGFTVEDTKHVSQAFDIVILVFLVVLYYGSFYLTRIHTTNSCFHLIGLKFKTIDGAATLVLGSGKKAVELRLQVIAKIAGYGDATQAPELFTNYNYPSPCNTKSYF
ncbi:uncharacterized protein LOC132253179 [Vitis vinifera]|uniref:uncharacterized protein LOC132253179 n=1 Tax=Vitis vinifera TaxID=29760 RepID=UPI002882E4D3|nr:uncharacterized protein LOC132253179 [Vitis vinifera]